jgi:hypothetical protein
MITQRFINRESPLYVEYERAMLKSLATECLPKPRTLKEQIEALYDLNLRLMETGDVVIDQFVAKGNPNP